MGHELTPDRPDAGVTLIELLVVVAVLAVLAVGISVTATRNTGSAKNADMKWFQSQFDQYQRLAISSGQSFGVYVGPKDMRIARKGPEGWDIPGGAYKWRGKVSIANLNPQSIAGQPEILLLATGQSSTFDIAFGANSRCSTDGWNGVSCATR